MVEEEYIPYEDEYMKPDVMPDTDDFPDWDLYIYTEVLLPQNGEHMKPNKSLGN